MAFGLLADSLRCFRLCCLILTALMDFSVGERSFCHSVHAAFGGTKLGFCYPVDAVCRLGGGGVGSENDYVNRI